MAETENPLINKVASSGLLTIDLAQFLPKEPTLTLDPKNYLFMELILKEKDFREAMQQHDWSQYEGKNLAVHCSSDAIIPMWAFMLVAKYASPHAVRVFQGDAQTVEMICSLENMEKFDVQPFIGKKIVIKGCGDRTIPAASYLAITQKLRPIAQSIFYGEPCSTVPIFKKEKTDKL